MGFATNSLTLYLPLVSDLPYGYFTYQAFDGIVQQY